MGVRESLTLDHFYINVSDADFAELKRLQELFRALYHNKIETTDDAWEGLYLYSRPMSYFEILRNRYRPGFLGVCLSPYAPIKFDASKIREEFKDDWMTHSRILADGSPWFDWYSLVDDGADKDALFHPWIMHYHQRNLSLKEPLKPCAVDRFKRLHLTIGNDHLQEIERLTAWFPVTPMISASQIMFSIPDRDGFRFEIQMDVIPGNSRFEFQELELDHCHPEAFDTFSSARYGNFELSRSGTCLTLSKQDR